MGWCVQFTEGTVGTGEAVERKARRPAVSTEGTVSTSLHAEESAVPLRNPRLLHGAVSTECTVRHVKLRRSSVVGGPWLAGVWGGYGPVRALATPVCAMHPGSR